MLEFFEPEWTEVGGPVNIAVITTALLVMFHEATGDLIIKVFGVVGTWVLEAMWLAARVVCALMNFVGQLVHGSSWPVIDLGDPPRLLYDPHAFDARSSRLLSSGFWFAVIISCPFTLGRLGETMG